MDTTRIYIMYTVRELIVSKASTELAIGVPYFLLRIWQKIQVTENSTQTGLTSGNPLAHITGKSLCGLGFRRAMGLSQIIRTESHSRHCLASHEAALLVTRQPPGHRQKEAFCSQPFLSKPPVDSNLDWTSSRAPPPTCKPITLVEECSDLIGWSWLGSANLNPSPECGEGHFS